MAVEGVIARFRGLAEEVGFAFHRRAIFASLDRTLPPQEMRDNIRLLAEHLVRKPADAISPESLTHIVGLTGYNVNKETSLTDRTAQDLECCAQVRAYALEILEPRTDMLTSSHASILAANLEELAANFQIDGSELGPLAKLMVSGAGALQRPCVNEAGIYLEIAAKGLIHGACENALERAKPRLDPDIHSACMRQLGTIWNGVEESERR